jgi:hypothetical protein
MLSFGGTAIDLPSWLQFVLTMIGGWVAGVGTLGIVLWRRMVDLEQRVLSKLQSIEQTVYGRREAPGGLVAQMTNAEHGIDRIEKLLVRLCEHLKIPHGSGL